MKLRIVPMVAAAALASACSDATAPDTVVEYDVIFEGTNVLVAELFRVVSPTEAERLLTPGAAFSDPSPLPDGSRIVGAIANYAESTGDIWIVNRNGSGITQLTFDEELDDHPAVSPNGSKIAFRSHRTLGAGDIWIMNVDGSNPVNLTPDPLPAVTDEGRPAWSPNGARIAYSSNSGGGYDIWTMNANGTDKQRLTTSADFESEPAWSPDGSTIAFRRSTLDDSDIYLVPAAGGVAVPIALPGHQRMPVWSPDGSQLFFVSHSIDARPDLYRVRPDGTQLTPVMTTGMPGGSLNPAFLRR